MSESMYQFDQKAVNELSTIEVAYEILKQSKKTFIFKDLADKIGEVKNLSNEKLLDYLPQLYTEINIDGRFIHLGKNEWGLKSWYPLEKAEASVLKDNDNDDEDEDEINYLNDDEDEVVEDDEDNLFKDDKDEDDDDDDDEEEEEIDEVIVEDDLGFEDDEDIEEEEDEEKEEDDEEIDSEKEEDFDYYTDELKEELYDEDESEDNI